VNLFNPNAVPPDLPLKFNSAAIRVSQKIAIEDMRGSSRPRGREYDEVVGEDEVLVAVAELLAVYGYRAGFARTVAPDMHWLLRIANSEEYLLRQRDSKKYWNRHKPIKDQGGRANFGKRSAPVGENFFYLY
jgi:hypothetical protein